MRIVMASNNAKKLVEFKHFLEPLGIEAVPIKQLGIDVEVVEDGETFEKNAIKKAQEICKICNEVTISDDSGLEVDYLNGQPGVYSARFSGLNATDEKNNQKLLQLMDGVPTDQRVAKFTCVIAVAFPDGRIITSIGECQGVILTEYRGNNDFGYDPLFYYPPLDKTFAELGKEEKNKVSHRGNALRGIVEKLKIF